MNYRVVPNWKSFVMDVFYPSYFILLHEAYLLSTVKICPFLNQSCHYSMILESSNQIFIGLYSSLVKVSNLTTSSWVNSNYIHLSDMMTSKYLKHCCQVWAYFFLMLQILRVKFCFWLILYDLKHPYLHFDWNFFFVEIILTF